MLPLLLLAALAASRPVAAQEPVNIAEAVRGDSAGTGFVADLLHWYDAHMNYWAVAGLMTVESSFIPFPSEVVIPPAVYVACNPESKGGMNVWMVVLFGTAGALLGALINYFLSMWLGRPIVYAFARSKVGRMLQLSEEKMQRAETYFNDHGKVSTLVGRFIPVIRQLISIPAGLSRMHLGSFCFFTTLGALAWNLILALFGWLAYKAADPTVIEKYSRQLSIVIIVLLAAAIAFLVARHYIKKGRDGRKPAKRA
ncbi:MAG: DedA family protein [Bacteroidales bacterium]|nr:DedA family protein [Bacteroidales bacterium]